MKIGSGTATARAMAIAISTLLLTMALVTPVLGGGPLCSLQATVGGGSATEVETGEEVLIEGFGFPANGRRRDRPTTWTGRRSAPRR